MRKLIFHIVICSWTVLYGPALLAAAPPTFTIANTIQSNMVLQQAKPFKVWGQAVAGQRIEVKADWMQQSVTTSSSEQQEWITEIPVPKATPGDYTPHTILISSGKDTVWLRNILIGEVWLCSGQSNMDMELKPFIPWLRGVVNYEQEIRHADYPAIRLYNVRTDFKAEPENDCINGSWKICTPATVPDFSGVAYFFARELHQQLRLPIGLVVSSVGGSACQIWTSRETLEKDPVLNQKYLYPYDTSALSREPLDSVVTFEKVVRPTLFYNAMIYPLRNLSLRGMLWYQGESNRFEREAYTRLTSAMIGNWRSLFNQGDLPFYYVQVAPFKWEGDTTWTNYYGYFREAQEAVMKQTRNTGMAVIMDLGEADDLHPRNKQQVGIRLAKMALNRDYKKPVAYKGPQYKSMRVEGNTVKVSFQAETTGDVLATSDAQAPMHFYVAGTDQQFHPAKAVIRGNEVWVQSAAVAKPVAVRYAFSNYPVTNLCNKAGLPAVPFRSDNWPEPAAK
ncbi:MAG: sialate O-acetylesterase [Pseudobacter sp.]|uniref:sialate O-acetylesterase n=1 Tax=Pseudobacter sp. TaxID=2045420 RepID=UPI003F7EFCCD